jgi:hypothetical protein
MLILNARQSLLHQSKMQYGIHWNNVLLWSTSWRIFISEIISSTSNTMIALRNRWKFWDNHPIRIGHRIYNIKYVAGLKICDESSMLRLPASEIQCCPRIDVRSSHSCRKAARSMKMSWHRNSSGQGSQSLIDFYWIFSENLTAAHCVELHTSILLRDLVASSTGSSITSYSYRLHLVTDFESILTGASWRKLPSRCLLYWEST